jgi:hypothetical protein
LYKLRLVEDAKWDSGRGTRFAFSGDAVGISAIKAWPGSFDIFERRERKREATILELWRIEGDEVVGLTMR